MVALGPTLPELEAPDAFCAKAAPDSATTQAEAISIVPEAREKCS